MIFIFYVSMYVYLEIKCFRFYIEEEKKYLKFLEFLVFRIRNDLSLKIYIFEIFFFIYSN